MNNNKRTKTKQTKSFPNEYINDVVKQYKNNYDNNNDNTIITNNQQQQQPAIMTDDPTTDALYASYTQNVKSAILHQQLLHTHTQHSHNSLISSNQSIASTKTGSIEEDTEDDYAQLHDHKTDHSDTSNSDDNNNNIGNQLPSKMPKLYISISSSENILNKANDVIPIGLPHQPSPYVQQQIYQKVHYNSSVLGSKTPIPQSNNNMNFN